MEVRIVGLKNTIQVFVPFAMKARAKQIPGYRWDTHAKAWVYPNTSENFGRIVAEFGDIATIEGFSNVVAAHRSEPDDDLEARLAALEASRRDVEGSLSAQLKASELISNKLLAVNKELLKQLNDQEQAVEAATAEAAALREQEAEARKALAQARRDLANKPIVPIVARRSEGIRTAEKSAMERAVRIANDPTFIEAVINTPFQRLAFSVASVLEARLRALLGVEPGADFNSLIKQARDAELIDGETHGMLNTVRHNRNKLAHVNVKDDELWARTSVALMLGALTWGRLRGLENK